MKGFQRPKHYKVALKPNFDTFEFTGKVVIQLEVLETTRESVCNAHQVQVTLGAVLLGEKVLKAHVTHEADSQSVRLQLDEELNKGSQVIVQMEFKGYHNDQMAGFYRSGYTVNGIKKYMMVTQFQATDCRRCFPCWDEPDLKATFDISLEIPKDLVGLSNMNVISESIQDGYKTVDFATTPLMSTYLLAICVGEFEFVEATAKPVGAYPIECRVYTSPGQKELGRFGLDICTKAQEFYSPLFGIPYPLTKMDMIGIPDFGLGTESLFRCHGKLGISDLS